MFQKSKTGYSVEVEKYISVPEYDDETYLKIFPEATKEELANYGRDDEFEIIEKFEKEHNVRCKGIRKVIIDEEYFEWLKVNNLQENNQNCFTYMNELSDEEVHRLWLKTFGDEWLPFVYLLSFLFVSKEKIEASFTVPKKIQRLLQKHIVNVLNVPSKDVYVHNEMFHSDSDLINKDSSLLLDKTVSLYFRTGKLDFTSLNPFTTGRKANIHYRFIPIFVKSPNRSVDSREQLEHERDIEYSIPDSMVDNFVGILEKSYNNQYDITSNKHFFSFHQAEEVVNKVIDEETRKYM